MSAENNVVINLDNFRVTGSKVFTGRDRGKKVRQESRLDELEAQAPHIEIIIPENVYSINPSFFEEFLLNVVTKLGKEKFFNKFTFTSVGDYEFSKPLNEAIDRILRDNTAIG